MCQLTDCCPGEGPLALKPGQRFGDLGVILDSPLVLPVELIAGLVRLGCVHSSDWGTPAYCVPQALRFRYRTSLYSRFILVAVVSRTPVRLGIGDILS